MFGRHHLVIVSAFLGSLSLCASAAAASSDMTRWCESLSKDLKSVHYDLCLKRAWKFDSTSVKGHPIPYLYWGKPPESNPPSTATSASGGGAESDPRRVLILGAIH